MKVGTCKFKSRAAPELDIQGDRCSSFPDTEVLVSNVVMIDVERLENSWQPSLHARVPP